MLKRELIHIFRTARPVLRHQAFDIKMAMTDSARGHLIVITPRAVGNAPERNLIRRRIKAIFHEQGFNKKEKAWLFFVKKAALSLPFTDLQKIIVAAVGER